MGFMEKKRCTSFFKYVAKFDENDKSTWKDFDVMTSTFIDLVKEKV